MHYRDRNSSIGGEDVKLSPVTHFNSNNEGCRMVLMQIDSVDTLRQFPRYKIYINLNTTRFISSEDLPAWLHLKLTMINAISTPIKFWLENYSEADFYVHHQYLDDGESDFQDIGWRVYTDTYIIVMTDKQLKEIESGKREES
tara:strand:- start:2224 stop:2652 length:429 start_codon:yes stop_codon:yes gene_type:complete